MKGQDIHHANFTFPDSISAYATKKSLELFSNSPLDEIPCAYCVEMHIPEFSSLYYLN